MSPKPQNSHAVENFFTAMWYGNRGWSFLFWRLLFLPLSWLFQWLAWCRKQWQRRAATQWPVPLIVVGNIAVGGTGKTPLVIALVQSLQQQGWRPAVISRGYGSAAPRYPFAVNAATPPGESGDEPLLIAQRTGVPVVIGADRAASVQALLAGNKEVDIIVSDDGLQHYRLWRDVEIAVIDGSRGVGNGRCLPAGPLRESRKRLAQVDWVVVNGEMSEPNAKTLPISRVTAMQIQAAAWINMRDGGSSPTQCAFGGQKVHAVAAIGNPQRFFRSLEQTGVEVIPHIFPDHYRFNATDIVFDDAQPVVMTEKDAVKCRALMNELANPDRYWYLRIDAVLDSEFFTDVDRRCRQAASVA